MTDTKSKKTWVIDSTLRDGEQSPGSFFSLVDKTAIAEGLSKSGVDEIEAGIAAMGYYEQKSIRSIVQANLPVRVTTWCRAARKDIDAAIKCGTDSVHISFPVSERQFAITGMSKTYVIDLVAELVEYARENFDYVSTGALDATRSSAGFLNEFIKVSEKAGAYRVRIADTVGIGTPSSVYKLIRTLKQNCNITIEFHGHNDLGMATANTISAIEAGAGAFSGTINGLGERAGNAPTEEVVTALKMTTPYFTSVQTDKLIPLCKKVAELSGIGIPVNKPITGKSVFTHESGIHCNGLVKDPLSFQPFLPEEIGRHCGGFVIGKHSGRSAVQSVLKSYGIEVSPGKAEEILQHLKTNYIEKNLSFNNEDLICMC